MVMCILVTEMTPSEKKHRDRIAVDRAYSWEEEAQVIFLGGMGEGGDSPHSFHPGDDVRRQK